MTAGVVAANVAANVVNNANQNNNNNNNNNNQDNTNNNNMNVGNSDNMNTNMNMLLPGRRSISSDQLIHKSFLQAVTGLALAGGGLLFSENAWNQFLNTRSLNKTLENVACNALATPSEVNTLSDLLFKVNRISLGLLTSDLFQSLILAS